LKIVILFHVKKSSVGFPTDGVFMVSIASSLAMTSVPKLHKKSQYATAF